MKRFIWLVLPLILCLSCIKEDPNAKRVYVLIPTGEITERWETDKRYIAEAFGKYDIELTVKTFNDLSQASLQVEELQKAISSGIRNFIITPIDYNIFNESKVFEGHDDLNIVCHDRMIYNNSAVDYFSSCDVGEVGKLQAEYIISKASKEKMTLEILAGPTSDNNSLLLFDGAFNTLKPYIDKGSFDIVSGKKTFIENALPSWEASSAKQEMSERLKKYYPNKNVPDIIICPNDNCAEGAILAVYEHNPDLTDYPITVGQDNSAGAQALIKKGTMSMTVDKSIRDMSYNSVSVMVNLMKGIEPTTPYYYDNGARYIPYIKAAPKTITIDNLD